jgi:hypothetical protein
VLSADIVVELAIITATAGMATAQEAIQVQASSGPVLTVPSTQAARLGKALRFTVSAADPAGLPVQLAAVNVPVGASFDAASGLFEWIPSASQGGKYKVTFSATNSGRQSSSAEVTVNVSSGLPGLTSSERLVCSPGALASLNGSGFAEPSQLKFGRPWQTAGSSVGKPLAKPCTELTKCSIISLHRVNEVWYWVKLLQ